MFTDAERKERRKVALKKYNSSDKRKATSARYREKHREKCNRWSREWQINNKVRARKTSRLWRQTASGKVSRQATEAKYYAINRHKRLAKDAVNNAIRAGRLKKSPCGVCGNKNSQGHHPDYSKPLEVIWLCHEHHHMIHNPRKD